MSAVMNPDDSDGRVSLTKIAQAVLVEHGNDSEKASAAFLSALARELPAVYNQKQREAMGYWADRYISDARTELRSEIADVGSAKPPPPMQPLGIESLKAFSYSWFNWPVNGKLLGQAVRTDLLAAVQSYRRDAETILHRGNWLEAIAKKLPNDSTPVSKVLNEAAIAKLAAQHGVSRDG